jgi:hypothetical protein
MRSVASKINLVQSGIPMVKHIPFSVFVQVQQALDFQRLIRPLIVWMLTE